VTIYGNNRRHHRPPGVVHHPERRRTLTGAGAPGNTHRGGNEFFSHTPHHV
jgi:hypothetical protein